MFLNIARIFKTNIFILLALLLFQSTLIAQTTAGEEYQLANEAYEAKNYPVFLSHLEKANELRPNHRTILYNLAVAYSLNEQYEEAINTLSYRASFYAVNDFSEDEELSPLKELPSYLNLIETIQEQNKPILNSSLHFEIEKKGFHPEGISIQPSSGNFFISDVRCGLINSFDKNGENKTQLFDLKDFGFWGAMGMTFDKSDSNILWVTTSVLPQFCEFSDSLSGNAAVLKIDLDKKRLIQSYSVEGNHVFGDIISADDGTVYVTDSSEPVLYRITKDKDKLEPFFRSEKLFNLQGLAHAEDRSIYISDYITGVSKLNLINKSLEPVLYENQITRGTDGLYYADNQLLLLQNGTQPFQVAKVNLKKASLEVLDVAVPELNEPTLGVIYEGTFYFISNSPWAFYDENGIPMLEEWPMLQIRKLKLD